MSDININLPPLNERVLAAIMETCLDSLMETEQGNKLQAIGNVATEALRGAIQGENFNDVEDLVGSVAWYYGMEMFKMGLAIGLEPKNIFKLPDMPW